MAQPVVTAPAAAADPIVPQPDPITGMKPSAFRNKALGGGFEVPGDKPTADPIVRTFADDDDPPAPIGADGEPNVQGDGGEENILEEGAGAEGEPELIHGLAVDAILEALRAGRLPPELLEKLSVMRKTGDQEVMIPLAGKDGEYLRQLDYSRNMGKLKAERQEFEQRREGFLDAVESWRDESTEDSLRRTIANLEQLKVPVRRLAEIIATDYAKRKRIENDVPEHLRPFVGELMSGNEQLRRDMEALRSQSQQAGNEAQQRKQQERTRAVGQKLQGLALPEFERAGVKLNDISRPVFVELLRSVWDGGLESLTAEMVSGAVAATKEHFEEMAQKYQAANGGAARPAVAPARAAQPPPVRRTAGAPGASGNGGARRTGGYKASDFARRVAQRQGLG